MLILLHTIPLSILRQAEYCSFNMYKMEHILCLATKSNNTLTGYLYSILHCQEEYIIHRIHVEHKYLHLGNVSITL